MSDIAERALHTRTAWSVEAIRRSLTDNLFYAACQEEVGHQYRDRERWARMSILNVARMGYFSSDRAVAEHCRVIWKAQRVSLTAD